MSLHIRCFTYDDRSAKLETGTLHSLVIVNVKEVYIQP